MDKNSLISVLTSTLILGGCSASTCDVEVYLGDDLKEVYGEVPTMEVDVAGVTDEQKDRLLHSSAEAYFEPGSPLRRSLNALTLHFSAADTAPYIIPDSHKAWQLWEERGASYIALMCNLPAENAPEAGPAAAGAGSSGGGNALNDGRLLLINMHDGFLKDSSRHVAEITAGGIIEIKEAPSSSALLRQVEP